MSAPKYITEPASVALSRIGELKIDGKPALNLTSDLRSASKQIFWHLAARYPDILAAVPGLGLSVKGSNGAWRRIPLAQFQALICETFVLLDEQIAPDGTPRLVVVDKPRHTLWLPQILQSRWLDSEAQAWFHQPPAPVGKLVGRI
jgi:hypothetical protein